MNGTFNSFLDVLVLIAVGGMLGTFGQGMRAIIGLKKLQEKAQAAGTQFNEMFSTSKLSLSLLIGFIAGGIGILTVRPEEGAITTQYLLMIVAIGYAGVDFIEGFVQRSLPQAPLARNPRNDAVG